MIHPWDKDYYSLLTDINQLQRQLNNLPDRYLANEVNYQLDKIQQNSAKVAVANERCLNIVRSQKKKANKAMHAFNYWAKLCATKMRMLSEEYVNLQLRKMWLKLLQTRFTESAAREKQTMEAMQLVELVDKKKNLSEVEAGLKWEISNVLTERNALLEKYSSIHAADQNWAAANSMSARLGSSFEHAGEHPSHVALQEFMKNVSIPLKESGSQENLFRLNKKLTEKSNEIVRECAQIAARYAKDDQDKVDSKMMAQFVAKLDDLEAMNNKVIQSFESLKKSDLPTSRPKIIHRPAAN